MPHYESTLEFDKGRKGKTIEKQALPDEICYKIQRDTLDTFVFKHSGLVCSLEHQELKHCFSEGNDKDPNCEKVAKLYGDCLYRRHHFASATVSLSSQCYKQFLAYSTCVKLSKFFNHGSNKSLTTPSEIISNQLLCEDLLYKDYLYCLKFALKVHNGPFDSEQ
ncbi:hypothetical protein ABK040_002076 [Willaertia magna]